MLLQTSTENIVKVKVSELKKGNILAYIQNQDRKVKITHIKFEKWANKKVAFFDFIELDTLKKHSHGFVECDLELLKVEGYEELEQTSLRCNSCNKLLGKATFKGLISLKCPKCKEVNDFTN